MDVTRKFLVAVTFALLAASCGTVQEATLVDGDSAESLAYVSSARGEIANTTSSDEISSEDGTLEEDGSLDDNDSPSEDAKEDDGSSALNSDPTSNNGDEQGGSDESSDDASGQPSTSSSTPQSTSTSPSTTTASTTTAPPPTAAPTTTTTAAPTTAAPATTQPPRTTTTRPPTTTTTRPPATTTTRPPATTAAPTTTAAAPSTGESAVEAAASDEIFRLVNCARTGSSNWCQPGDDANWNPAALANERPGTALTRSAALDATSITWSKQLTNPNQAFAHSPRSGIDYGENVAYYGRSTTGASITPHGAIEAATNLMNQWMNSSGHRTNLLRSSYTTMGVGTAYDVEAQNFAIYGTQQFS